MASRATQSFKKVRKIFDEKIMRLNSSSPRLPRAKIGSKKDVDSTREGAASDDCVTS